MSVLPLILAGLALFAPPAPTLRCSVVYGDETTVVDVTPTTDPYHVRAVPIGRYFAFKAVWIAEPAEQANVSLYVYRNFETGDVLLCEVKLVPPYPAVGADARYGFTGLHLVYEPVLARELRFWCAWGAP